MGIPQNQEPSEQPTQQNQPTAQPPTQQDAPKSTSDLPPEALDLASKLFDLARTGQTDSLSQVRSSNPLHPPTH